MNTPGSNKKRNLILATIIISIPLVFVSTRLFMHRKPVQQAETSPSVTSTQQQKQETASAVSSKSEKESRTESKRAIVGATTGGPGHEEAIAPVNHGFLARVLGGLGIGGAAKNALLKPNLPDAGTSGAPATNSVSGNSAPQVAQAPVPPPEPMEGCITETFHHKKTAGHTSEEACTQHRNLIHIKYAHISQVCIRVNRMPVAYQPVKGKTNEFIVGPVAGPRAEITARYCFGKTKCDEDCSIPKDDFMDSIGGDPDEKDGKQVAQWDPSDAPSKDGDVNGHLDADMKKELDHLDEKPADELFADWISGTETPACGAKHAMNE